MADCYETLTRDGAERKCRPYSSGTLPASGFYIKRDVCTEINTIRMWVETKRVEAITEEKKKDPLGNFRMKITENTSLNSSSLVIATFSKYVILLWLLILSFYMEKM